MRLRFNSSTSVPQTDDLSTTTDIATQIQRMTVFLNDLWRMFSSWQRQINAQVQRPTVLSVAYASNVTLDCATADIFVIVLTGTITVSFSNARNGQKNEVWLHQDGSGGRVVNWGGMVKFGTDVTATAGLASPGANARDRFGFVYDDGASKWDMVASARGY